MLTALFGHFGFRKNPVVLPFVLFFFTTFGARVIATQCPITCPKRQLQMERYTKVAQN
jgi:hypothetical protein